MLLLDYLGWFLYVVNKVLIIIKVFLYVFYYWCKLKIRWIDYLYNDKMIFFFVRVK